MARSKSALSYSPEIKEAFFDKRAVMNAMEKKTWNTLFWFGGRVREKTRSYLGKPNIQGEMKVRKDGSEYATKARKPRPAPKPPIPRVKDGSVTLRNIQYKAEMTRGSSGGDWGKVTTYGLKFSGTERYSGGKAAPELHEFGGTVKARARLVTKRTKTGKPSKRKGQVQRRLIFGRKFPVMTFRIPKRPYLGPTFQKVKKELKKRLAQGRMVIVSGRFKH